MRERRRPGVSPVSAGRTTRWLAGPLILGLAGTLTVAIAAPPLVDDPVRWWFSLRLGSGQHVVLYAGMAAAVAAWLWLGRGLRTRRASEPPAGRVAAVGALWSIPLLAAPPLFSHDLSSYLAQGTIAHLGHNPYHDPPTILASLGHASVLHAVSPFWRHTTAPYGPLFLALVSLVVGVTGSNLVAGAIVVRALVVVLAFAALARLLPRLATRVGGSPALATWFVLLNPLVLFQLISPGHNDLLMAGLVVGGVILGVEGRPLAGILVCAVAATIKVPALAGVAFLAVLWLRQAPDSRGRIRVAAAAVLCAGGALVLVSLASGLGFGWITGAVFSTPRKVHLAITPATALGWTVASALHGVGVPVGTRSLESAFGYLALAAVTVFGLWQLWRVDRESLVRRLGLVMLAFALGGPAAWPWYLSWGLVLLAACALGAPGTAALVATSVLAAFVVKANGILALPLPSAPVVLGVYAVCVAAGWWAWSRRSRRAHEPPADPVSQAAGGGELVQIR